MCGVVWMWPRMEWKEQEKTGLLPISSPLTPIQWKQNEVKCWQAFRGREFHYCWSGINSSLRCLSSSHQTVKCQVVAILVMRLKQIWGTRPIGHMVSGVGESIVISLHFYHTKCIYCVLECKYEMVFLCVLSDLIFFFFLYPKHSERASNSTEGGTRGGERSSTGSLKWNYVLAAGGWLFLKRKRKKGVMMAARASHQKIIVSISECWSKSCLSFKEDFTSY